MVETMQTSKKDGHFNESIVNEEILEDQRGAVGALHGGL